MSIDRLVAERVMGWTVNKEQSPYRWNVPLDTRYYHEWDTCFVNNGCPRFSDHIADAWEVVEHLERQSPKWLCKLVRRAGDLADFNQIGWTCELRWIGVTRPREEAFGVHESAPMAICLAALRAVGVSEQEIEEAK